MIWWFNDSALPENVPTVFVPSGIVLQALHWGLHGWLLTIDVADQLSHPARQTSLNHPHHPNPPKDRDTITGQINPFSQKYAALLPKKRLFPPPPKKKERKEEQKKEEGILELKLQASVWGTEPQNTRCCLKDRN